MLINPTYARKKEGFDLNNNISCPLLKVGSSGASVKRLQIKLGSAGFNPGKIDGIFGSLTREAVINFQNTKKLVRDGIVGRSTWAALGVNCNTTSPGNSCPTLQQGNNGSAVVTLQGLLKKRGFYEGNLDGVFGSLTREAVINFQNTKKLVRDGIVGRKTWTALGVNCS